VNYDFSVDSLDASVIQRFIVKLDTLPPASVPTLTNATAMEVYSYFGGAWSDQLMSVTKYTNVNGELLQNVKQTMAYDGAGNPTSYKGITLTWEGKRLTGYNSNATFAYDENGIRTSKTVGSTTTTYHYNGSLLMSLDYGGLLSELKFSYDASGQVVMVSYNGGDYYYVRNGQGDIIKLIDGTGADVVRYTYDTWGKLLNMWYTPNTGNHWNLGYLNPFRYRGYVYDEQTGWYYCQSRYYDPEVGRFISADALLSTGQGILGYNMYAYCGNNPVSRSDSTGMFWKEIGDFFKDTFGAGSSTVHQEKAESNAIVPDPWPVTIKQGVKTTTTISEHGNSSKPISVYAQGRSDKWEASSVGLKVNVGNFTLKVSLGLDNIGISGAVKDGDATKSFGLTVDIVDEFNVRGEYSKSEKISDNTSAATYTNVGVNGGWILLARGLYKLKSAIPTRVPARVPAYYPS
jgi:RHS repeat-associated protein